MDIDFRTVKIAVIASFLLIYSISLLFSILIRLQFTSAADYEYYCKGQHYARIDYIFPSYPAYCWLEEEVK